MFCFKKRKEVEEYRKQRIEDAQKHWSKEHIQPLEIIYERYSAGNDAEQDNQIVFIDIDYDLDWITSSDPTKESIKLINKIMRRTALPYKNLSCSNKIYFLRYLGEGIVAAFAENSEAVNDCLRQADSCHRKYTLEWNRQITLATALLSLIAVFLIAFFSQQQSIMLTSCFWGVIGAFMSITYRNNSKSDKATNNRLLIILETITRLIVGSLSAWISFYLLNNLFIKLNDSFTTDLNNFIIIAFVAGFSEKLIPSLVSKYENQFAENKV